MSWDKNTINLSAVDSTIATLKKLGVKYKLTELDKVMGRGMNDGGNFPGDEEKYYSIRKLEYKDVVILEQMVQAFDCDDNDMLISHEFKKGEELKDWKTVIEESEDGDGELAKV